MSHRYSSDAFPWDQLTVHTASELDATVRHTMTQLQNVRDRLAAGNYSRAIDELDPALQAFSSLHRHALRLAADLAAEGVKR